MSEGARPPRPVSLTRLLSVAALTPAQAVLVAAQLLHAASTRATAAATSSAEARFGEVTVTASGDVEVGAPLGDDSAPTLTELLEQVAQNARRLPAHPRPEHLRLLRKLEDVVRDPLPGPESRARDLEASLVDIVGSDAGKRLTAQLAALVRAFAHVTGVPTHLAASRGAATPAPPRAAALLPATPPPPPAPGRHPHRPSRAARGPAGPPRGRAVPLRGRSRSRRAGLVALVLTAALTATGYVLLRGPGATLVESLGPDREPDAPATAAPSAPPQDSTREPEPPRRQAVPALADRRAGPITAVALQKVSGCRPGGTCQVKVTVRFRPTSEPRPIAWRVGAARRCERGVAWSPLTTVTAQPGWTTVFAHSTVRLPDDRSRALVAVTTTPARAQSRPVPLTGSSLRC